MSDDLRALEDWVAPLMASLTPAEQAKLARTIGTAVRRTQAERIAAQRNPDGSAYAPRKSPPGTGKAREQKGANRRAMFARMRTARHLKVQASPQAAAVGFVSRTARIARVHQYGLIDQVRPGGPSVTYARRELLGFTGEERESIKDLLLQHLSP